MATTVNPESIQTYMTVTGASESVAIAKLQEHGGDLNQAVNAHFSEPDRNTVHGTSVADPVDDFMEIDDPTEVESLRAPSSLFPPARNPFSLLDSNFPGIISNGGTSFTSYEPSVSHPREVRQIPIEVKDGNGESDHSGHAPKIEDVTDTSHEPRSEVRGTVVIDDDDDDYIRTDPTLRGPDQRELVESVWGNTFSDAHGRASAPGLVDLPDYGNDIEEQMVMAAIEASKRDAEMGLHSDLTPQQRQSPPEDPNIPYAVSLSPKTAEQENASSELGHNGGPSNVVEEELEPLAMLNGRVSRHSRLEKGSSSALDEPEDLEEQPLVRHRSRRVSSGSIDTARDIEDVDYSPPSSPEQQQIINHSDLRGSDFPSDEWGGISSEEHDEAVMLEAALFGGLPEGSRYPLSYGPHNYLQNGVERTVGSYTRRTPRPPSPSLTAQRLIREQQDDEYLASLQADREKELREQAAREAAIEEERQKEEELRRKLEEEQEIERQIAAKEASLPQEPLSDDENAVTLLVRMPDGSRRGRRFVKTDRLQYLFDFIDVGKMVKPGTYRLVRPYPRRAFSDGESGLTLNELGLTSKQEALFLELI